MSKIYVFGGGGMGNFLFQIAAGIYYKEKYTDIYDEIILIEGEESSFDWGTSNIYDRNSTRKSKNGELMSYKYTILNKFNFGKIDKSNILEIKNDYTCNHRIPSGEHLYITGYNQNSHLFIEYLNKIPQYLNLEDEEIKSYLRDKYPALFLPERKNIMVGIRSGDDFAHMTKVGAEAYKLGLEFFEEDENTNIVVITDRIDKIDNYLTKNKNIIVIDEDDIVQLYAGLVCDYFILSESTYHYWIAALKSAISPEKTKVVCFADTDITNRNLALPEWYVL
jgi:hypothetical protein